MSLEGCDIFTSSARPPVENECYFWTGVARIPAEQGQFFLRAIDLQTGDLRCSSRRARLPHQPQNRTDHKGD